MKVGYARVSSREQTINCHALEQQIERLKLAGAEEVFVDVESGYKGRKREQLERLMEKVRSRLCSEVIVTRLDRLSRRGRQAFALFDEFLESGVVLKALDEPIDLSTPSGKMTAGLLAVLAQHHSDQKSEAVRHGWQHLRNRGVAMNPPFGYRKVDSRHALDDVPFVCLLETREEKSRADVAAEIIEAFFTAQTLRGCLRVINERYGIQTFAHHQKTGGLYARGLFRFSVGGLRTWLTNPVLRGHTCYLRKRNGQNQSADKWDIRYNTHGDILLTDVHFQEIERILAHNYQVKGYGTTGQKYPLSGLIYCGECRSSCYSLKSGRGKTPGYNYYFQCKNWRTRSCNQKSLIRMERLEEAVILELTKAAERIADYASEPETEIESKEIRELKQQLSGLELLGNNPAIEQAKKEINNQIQGLKIKERSQKASNSTSRDLLLWAFSDPDSWLTTATTQEKIQIFKSLVEKIVVKNGQVVAIELKV